MKAHTIEQAVRYAETDRMKVVHHSTYLLWFEIGRMGLLAAAGFPYDQLEASGTLFPVVVFACRLNDSADFGDTVTIETRIANLRSRSVEFSYKILNQGKVIASGMTRHVAVDASQKAKRLPDDLLRALAMYVVASSEF